MDLIYPIPAPASDAPYAVAPIRDAAPKPARGLASGLALVVPALLLFAATTVVISETAPAFLRPERVVDVLLTDAPEAPRKVVPNPIPDAPEGPGKGPGLPGVGHVEGNDAIDPELLKAPVNLPTARTEPDPLALLEPQSPTVIGRDRSLPVAKGGNGLASGTGLDAGRGGGGGRAKGPDYELVLLHEEPALTDITAHSPDLLIPVKVLVQIGNNGHPLSAEAVSGPARLHASCIETAMRYRWEPLAPHGLKAPVPITITFHPVVRPSHPGMKPVRDKPKKSEVPDLF